MSKMPKLNRIVLQGFKSFGKKTEIQLASGFTCIAGPNGSGKSNIVDALTFVLGVTSARAIRAQKLQNLIWNGGKDGKPAEFCEVEVEFDNSDRAFPIDAPIIRIARRITRSGISVYKLNGRTVPKNKVLDILWAVGLSPEGHNIIMQGDITRIVESSPKQRREIIDEISGIAEFNEKKADALAKLERVESRVREAMVVVAEKQRRLEQLKQQADAATKWQELNKKLRIANAAILKLRLEQTQNSLGELINHEKEFIAEIENIDKQLKNLDKELDSKEAELAKVSEQLFAKRSDTAVELERVKQELLRKNDQLSWLERDISFLERRTVGLVRKLPVSAKLLASVINVPPQYSGALEVALGGHAKDLVVANNSEAQIAIAHLKEHQIGRARFIPLENIRPPQRKQPPKADGVIGLAIDIIKYDPEYAPALSYALGNTLIVDTLENGLKIKNWRVVTLAGELIDPRGAIVGGYREHLGLFNLERMREEAAALRVEIDDLKLKQESLAAALEREETATAELAQLRKTLETEVFASRKERKELLDRKFSLQSSLNKIKIERARLEAHISDLKEQSKAYRDVREFGEMSNLSLEELQKIVSRCTSEIRALGAVNMRAIEEHTTLAVEFEQMSKKLDGLLKEKDAILATIAEIETKRKDKFMSTLTEISKMFTKIWADLTGGEGNVRLEDPNNIDSGLVIEASPAGKRVIDLDAMSGGERTLTSLAFLFAIMSRSRSPFYVLDEVEAALDKPNTRAIASLISKYSKETQFIVISHNDITMSASDRIFGCAMQGGQTRIFSIQMPRR
jgi:chromosome segregation ATPase